MRRPLVILIPLCFGLCALGATPYPNPTACYAIQSGLDGASDLAWVNDPVKAAQLRQAYSTVQFYGDLLASALRSGASVESTAPIEADLLNAGLDLRNQAAALGVVIPAGPMSQYLSYTQTCAQPYQNYSTLAN